MLKSKMTEEQKQEFMKKAIKDINEYWNSRNKNIDITKRKTRRKNVNKDK
jgi:hypothetical protein